MKILQAQTFNQALCSSFIKIFSGDTLNHVTDADRDKQTILNLQDKLDKVTFKYNAVFNSGDNYYIILDKHLNIVDFNDASVSLVKKVFGKMLSVGQYITNYLSGKLAEPIMNNCMRALRGDTFIVEYKVANGNKGFNWWQAEYSPAYNDMQHIAGITFNATEISGRKAREIKIEQQNQKLKAISLMQSHDIRGPLCTLMGLMSLLKLENMADSSGYLQHMDTTINLLDEKIKAIVECASESGQ